MPFDPDVFTADEARIIEAIRLLRSARDLLVLAKCPKTAERVRLALSSAAGAARAASHRGYRDERKAKREAARK
jgi:hypothetical protein